MRTVEREHYLHLKNAQVIPTTGLRATHDNMKDVLQVKGMMCLYGAAGVGKTLSTNASLRELAPGATVRVQFRSRPAPSDIRTLLFEQLHIDGRLPSLAAERDNLLKKALAEQFRAVVLDEAQWMTTECFEYCRHLWDDDKTDIAIIFVGGGDCYRVLRREPMLSSRVFIWQEMKPLTHDEVVTYIPAYHPVWSNAEPDDITFVDTHAAHGNLRAWAKITAHTLIGLIRAETDVPNRDILQWVFSRLGGSYD
ncbi:ATP-binding protein [Planobispora rosea]|uniref:ATP-binding protein n=1 Tax=Planobispora rosea TaxID=35762 RepID=UPI00083A7D7B|nr:ATP-binding protein [Planobispora rosea]